MASTTPSTSPSLPDEVTTRILSLILSFIVSEKNRNFAFLARHTHSVLAISNILSVTPANAADARLVCAKNNFLGPEELGFQWLTFREKRFESLTESVAVRVRRPGGVEERNKEGVSLGGLVEALALREEKKRSSGVKDNGGTKKRKRFLERREFDYDENIGREFLEFNFAGNEYVIPALATDGAATPNSTESTDSIATTASSQSIASVCQELEIEHIDALDTNDGSWVHLPTWLRRKFEYNDPYEAQLIDYQNAELLTWWRHNGKTFPFFRLPLELRNLVYEQVFLSAGRVSRSSRRPSDGVVTGTGDDWVNLLLVCRAFREEGVRTARLVR